MGNVFVTYVFLDADPENRLLATLSGFLVTCAVQSSSAAMAITLTAAAKGYIDFPTACAITLGANIGTTITAALASIGAPVVERRAALGHFLFNALGVIWPVALFTPLLAFVDKLVLGDPFGTGEAALLVAIPRTSRRSTPRSTCATRPSSFRSSDRSRGSSRSSCPARWKPNSTSTGSSYLTTPFGAAPELAIPSAQREVDRMAGITVKMIARINQALDATGAERTRLIEKIRNHERVHRHPRAPDRRVPGVGRARPARRDGVFGWDELFDPTRLTRRRRVRRASPGSPRPRRAPSS